jgi:plasmid maintenance system antidote protein VapI
VIGIKYICEVFNVSLTDLSKELDVTRANFYNWINGKRKMPEKYKIILSKKFNMPQDYFDKELTELDKLKIQNIKLHREAAAQETDDAHDELLSQVENQLRDLELQEAIESVNRNLKDMGKKEYGELEDITYSLKAFFDIYNSEKSRWIDFRDILLLIAEYLNIEGYRKEDTDNSIIPIDYEIKYVEELDKYYKKLFDLLDYRKCIEEEYEKAKKKFFNE